MTAAAPLPDLLDPGFVRELEALRRRIEIQARSGAGGEHTANRRGGAAEFQEHRAYAPGDDVRRIDWMAFARTGEPVLKVFRTDEDVVGRLVVDVSRSMQFGDPPKIDAARRLAAAVGYMLLAGSERAQVVAASEGRARAAQPSRGRAGLAGLLRELGALHAGGGTAIGAAVDTVVRRSARPGLLLVASDYLDAGPVLGALGRARQAGHDVAVVQVLARDEVEPAIEGDWLLADAETDATVDLTADAAAIEAYLKRLGGLVESLRRWAKTHGATYVRCCSDEPLEPVVRRFVARGID